MEIRKFRRKYDLELISAAGSHIILGTLVWDPIIGAPSFNKPGMPDHIYNAFRTSGLIDNDQMTDYQNEARQTDLSPAHFAERTIEIDMDHTASLKDPKIGEIEASFGLESVKKFSFGDLQVRAMTSLERVRIDEYLDILKKEKWDDYDGRIRRVFMITELYYGSVKVVIDRNMKGEFEAAMSTTNLELSAGSELSNSVEYSFSHQDVPFAMRIEKVKRFSA
jgi:hypothetical protein